jgi:hypothetical protein
MYGSDLRFFEALADGAGLDLFIRFAESKGFPFQVTGAEQA